MATDAQLTKEGFDLNAAWRGEAIYTVMPDGRREWWDELLPPRLTVESAYERGIAMWATGGAGLSRYERRHLTYTCPQATVDTMRCRITASVIGRAA